MAKLPAQLNTGGNTNLPSVFYSITVEPLFNNSGTTKTEYYINKFNAEVAAVNYLNNGYSVKCLLRHKFNDNEKTQTQYIVDNQ